MVYNIFVSFRFLFFFFVGSVTFFAFFVPPVSRVCSATFGLTRLGYVCLTTAARFIANRLVHGHQSITLFNCFWASLLSVLM